MASPTRRSTALLVSIALLGLNGVNHILALASAAARTERFGEFSGAVHLGNVIGSAIAVLLYFGLAYAQWKKGGKWGFAIGLFAILILVVQSALMYLALHSGRLEPTASVVARFVIFSVVGAGTLAVTSIFSYSHYRQTALARLG